MQCLSARGGDAMTLAGCLNGYSSFLLLLLEISGEVDCAAQFLGQGPEATWAAGPC